MKNYLTISMIYLLFLLKQSLLVGEETTLEKLKVNKNVNAPSENISNQCVAAVHGYAIEH